MNTKLIGALSVLVLFNTACSKEENTPPSYTNTSTAANAANTNSPNDRIPASDRALANAAPHSATSSVEVIESTLAEQSDADPTAKDFLNTRWKLIALNSNDIVTGTNKERAPHIIFNADNRVSGSDGCNSIMGTYTRDGDKLTLSQIASTMMACAEGGEHAHEFKQTLEKVTTLKIQGNQLELRDEKGSILTRFQAEVLPQ